MRNSFAETHIRHGNTCLKKGNLTSAIEEYSAAIRLVPTNCLYFNNRGVARYSNREFDEAIKDFTEAIRLDQKLIDLYFGRALVWQSKGDIDNAIHDFTKVINLTQNDDDAHYIPGSSGLSKDGAWDFSIQPDGTSQDSYIACAFVARGGLCFNKGEFDLAIKDYSEAITLELNSASAFLSRGAAWHAIGDLDKALNDYDEAIWLSPNFADAHFNRATIWHTKGKFDKALEEFSEAIRIEPKQYDAYIGRAICWQKVEEFDKAVIDCTQAIEIDPQVDAAYNVIAWFRATCPQDHYRDGMESVEYATKACELSAWKVWNNLGTLAAAYAESGDFSNAVTWAEKSLELAPTDEKQAAIERLELYRANKPYRDLTMKPAE